MITLIVSRVYNTNHSSSGDLGYEDAGMILGELWINTWQDMEHVWQDVIIS
mgnify:CR=1 FL=1